jgi:glycosyltransferase involved in cell wall biosynthesis
MRILYLAPDSVPAPKGASVRIERTVATLRALGHEVDLFTPAAGATGPGNFLERMLRFRGAAGAWLAGRRGDLVQFRSIWEGVAAIRWARRTGAPAVFEVHGLPSVELPYHFPALAREERLVAKIIAEERAVIAASDRFVAPSRTTARFLQRLGAPAEAVAVIPNAVDGALFSPGGASDAAGGLADEPPRRIVYVGTLAPWQGLATLCEALALLRGAGAFELHVVGPAKGTWTRGLRQLVARLRLRPVVHVSGPMAQRDLVPVLRAAHVCVAPLPADARNQLQGCCPIKLLEYMAAGRPILSTRVAPVEEILEHGATGHLVAPGSASALAAGLTWMAEHPDEREALGRRARATALARWGPEAFDRRTRELLAPLVAARRAAVL